MMAIKLEHLQYQGPHSIAARPLNLVHSAVLSTCRLPALRNFNVKLHETLKQQRFPHLQLNFQKLVPIRRLLWSSSVRTRLQLEVNFVTSTGAISAYTKWQSSHFFNTNSAFLLSNHNGLGYSKPQRCSSIVQAFSGKGWEDDDYNESSKQQGGLGAFVASLLKTVVKLAGVIILASAVLTAFLPTILSSQRGLNAVVSLASHTIPGTVSVAHASFGWKKPVLVEGITLKGVDGQIVVSIPKIETRASLWSIVSGKTGLGDTVVSAPMVDLQQDPVSGQPHLALALTPLKKLHANNPDASKKNKRPAPIEPPTDVALTATVKAPKGGFEVVNGKIILPRDVATVVGPSVFLDVAVGRFATEDNEALAKSVKEYWGKVPVRGNLYSDRAQAEGLGYVSLRRGQVQLLRPLKAEMDLTPALGKLYLARVNPLLGEIVGPAIGEEDLPDITVYVAPVDFVLPSDEYSFRIEPMRATLAKGQLVDGVLSLLSRQDLAKGRSQLTMQTSPIEATLNLKNGNLACSRLDLLIADRVHVATWGIVDTIHENVQMTLAIPGDTLRDVLGLSKLSHDYHLKIPIRGTFERPQVDWMAAGKGIAQLTLRQQKGGELFSSFFQQVEEPQNDVPQPIDTLPWDNRS